MPTNFVALDFELANPSHASVCAAGVARVRDGHLEDPRLWWCRPPHPYRYLARRNAELARLRAEDLREARGFDWLGPHLVRNIGPGIVVCHGAASADVSMFEKSWVAAGLGWPPGLRFACTLDMARKVVPDAPAFRLDALCAHVLGEPMVGHHRADADAYTTARLALALLERSGTDIEDWARTRVVAHMPKLKPPHRSWGDTAL